MKSVLRRAVSGVWPSLIVGLAGAAGAITALTPATAGARSAAKAHTASILGVRDEGRLHYVTDTATTIVDEGGVSGTIPGRARVNFDYNGSPTVTASFVIHTSRGSLYGRARCRLHNPTSPTPSFRGALSITAGSGRYARARGGGELFGVFHRRGYALVVQAIGRLRY